MDELIATNKVCVKVVVFIVMKCEVEVFQFAFSLMVVRNLTSGIKDMSDFVIFKSYPLLCYKFRAQKQTG